MSSSPARNGIPHESPRPIHMIPFTRILDGLGTIFAAYDIPSPTPWIKTCLKAS